MSFEKMSLEDFLNEPPQATATGKVRDEHDIESNEELQKLNNILPLISSSSRKPKSKLTALVAFEALQGTVQTSGIDVQVALEPLWRQHLNPEEIKQFILDFNDSSTAVSSWAQTLLLKDISKAYSMMPPGRHRAPADRNYLVDVLQRIVQAGNFTEQITRIIHRSMDVIDGKVYRKEDELSYQTPYRSNTGGRSWKFLGDRTRYVYEEDSDYDRFSPYVSDSGRYYDESD